MGNEINSFEPTPSHDSSALGDLQNQMLHLIFGSQESAQAGLSLYRELTRNVIKSTLSLIYVQTRKIVLRSRALVDSKKNWDELGELYIDQNWPSDWRINWAVQKFPEWLPADPRLKELADFEWARFLVRTGRDPTEVDWMNPTLVLRSYQFPVFKYWELEDDDLVSAIEQGEYSTLRARVMVQHQPEAPFCLAIFRHPVTMQVRILEVQPAAFELLVRWSEGETPESSAQWLAQQLECSMQNVMDQIHPLLKILIHEGVLLREGRKSTRNFLA